MKTYNLFKISVFALLIVFFLSTLSISAEEISCNEFKDVPLEQNPEFGCLCVMCLSSPEGPFQYEECHPSICRLNELLESGEPFPFCTTCDDPASCKFVNITVVACIPCEQTYGPGFHEYKKVESFDSQYGEYFREQKICRKKVGSESVEKCDDDGNCEMVDEAQYSEKPQRATYAVKIMYNGEQLGQTFYYEAMAKPGSKFF